MLRLLTNLTAANLTGALPAISGASLTGVSGGLVLVGSSVNMDSGGTTFFTAVNIDQCFTSTYQNYIFLKGNLGCKETAQQNVD